MNRYIAILCNDPESAFGLHFPDLPGCTAAGDTEDEAIANAAIALRLWMEDADELPKASTLAELRKRPDVRDDLSSGGIALIVPVVAVSRKQRLNIMLDPGIIEAADSAAKAAGVSRSLYIEQALEASLSDHMATVRVRTSRAAPPRTRTAS